MAFGAARPREDEAGGVSPSYPDLPGKCPYVRGTPWGRPWDRRRCALTGSTRDGFKLAGHRVEFGSRVVPYGFTIPSVVVFGVARARGDEDGGASPSHPNPSKGKCPYVSGVSLPREIYCFLPKQVGPTPSPQSVVGNGMIIDMLFEGKCLRKGTTFAPGVVLCPRGRALLAG